MISRLHRFLPVLILALFMAPGAARAAGGLFTVADIHVDAAAASSTEAMNAAIVQGRSRAFQILFRRLTRQQDWDRQPPLDAGALLRLSRGFTIAHERRSTTRYVADITYVFNPDAVARLLRANAIAYAQAPARRVLVIPMSPEVSHGPWSQALANPALQDSMVPYVVANAEEVASLFASMDDPQLFLIHDMQFHRAVAVASRNPILASLIEMVSTLFFEHRRPTAARATERNLRDAANMHRRIYLAIRAHDAEQARTLMDDHLRQAAIYHAEEAQDAVRAVAVRPAESRRRRNA